MSWQFVKRLVKLVRAPHSKGRAEVETKKVTLAKEARTGGGLPRDGWLRRAHSAIVRAPPE